MLTGWWNPLIIYMHIKLPQCTFKYLTILYVSQTQAEIKKKRRLCIR